MSYLLDTCVISALIAKRPPARVTRWVDAVDEERLFLSAITIGEVKRGSEKLAESRRKRALDGWLADQLLTRFAGRVLPIDAGVMLVWGELVARLEGDGRKLPVMDSLLAASALQGGLQLVTRNEKDFEGTGVALANPWKP